ncbi:MAG: TlpA disulfide reductase family protein [Sediminibacterium sp.]
MNYAILMKRLLLTTLLFFLFLLSSAQKITFTIEGTLTDIKKDATIWIGLVEPHELKGEAFKGEVSNGKFVIKGETVQPTLGTLALYLLDKNGKPLLEYPYTPKLQFALCSGKTIVSISDSFKVISVKSPCNNDQKKLENLDKALSAYDEGLKDLYRDQFNSMRKGDTALYFKSAAGIKKAYLTINPIKKNYLKTNGSSLLSAAILINNMSAFTTQEIDELYSFFSPNVKQSPIGKEILRRTELAKNPATKLIGKDMPDGELQDIKGKQINLSSFKGKYIFLDFWASWCSPCRKANPGHTKLYAKYGNTKSEFISVTIDTDKTKWLEAVKTDGLLWPQFIDKTEPGETGWYGKLFSSYRGNSVPLSFLISPEGRILQVNPAKETLERFLATIYQTNH